MGVVVDLVPSPPGWFPNLIAEECRPLFFFYWGESEKEREGGFYFGIYCCGWMETFSYKVWFNYTGHILHDSVKAEIKQQWIWCVCCIKYPKYLFLNFICDNTLYFRLAWTPNGVFSKQRLLRNDFNLAELLHLCHNHISIQQMKRRREKEIQIVGKSKVGKSVFFLLMLKGSQCLSHPQVFFLDSLSCFCVLQKFFFSLWSRIYADMT